MVFLVLNGIYLLFLMFCSMFIVHRLMCAEFEKYKKKYDKIICIFYLIFFNIKYKMLCNTS